MEIITNKESNVDSFLQKKISLETTNSFSLAESPSSLNLNEFLKLFAKKGFLLDREPLELFFQLGNHQIAEDILNKIHNLTKARIISKKTLIENYRETKGFYELLIKHDFTRQKIVDEFFKDVRDIIQQVEDKSLKEKTKAIEKGVCSTNLKIISSEIIPFKRIEVKDFVTHFKNRYNMFKDFLQVRSELNGLISINKIGTNRNFSIIALVRSKRVTKNKNIILEVEDLTGKINVLVNSDKEEIFKKAREVVLDDVIGLKCSGNGDFVYANDILFAESIITERKKSETEGYAIFISDIHLGSKLFLEEKFMKFIKWINGEGLDEAMQEKISKIKYLFIVGDNIDGVGVYPGQESLLTIKDCRSQYKRLAELFMMIPNHIKIIVCPGQHDAVRVPEPQPPIDADFAEELTKMPNVYLVSNPSTIEIECDSHKKGIRVLMYHGASMHSWIDEIEELRQGQANLNPSKVIKFMLKHRHLSPMHSGNVYVPSEKIDSLAIAETPDIIVTGDMHRTDVDIYNNILIICCSCWQSITPFEEKVGNQPDPCKVPMLNLKTREIKILDFN